MPWEGRINISGGEGFNMPLGGVLYMLGRGEGGGNIDMLWGRRAFGYQHPFRVSGAYFSSAVQVLKASGIEYNPVKVIFHCVVVQMEVIISSSSHTFLRIKCRVVKDPPSLLFSSSYSCKNANPDLQE